MLTTNYLDLTSTPLSLQINLSRDSDFVRVIEAVDSVFPTGARVLLDWGSVDWEATVTPTSASWNVDKVTVNSLMDAGVSGCKLRYIHNAVDLVWAVTETVIFDG